MSVSYQNLTRVNSRYAVLTWEPVADSGERINVGAIAQFNNKTTVKSLIREEVLRCMYGDTAEDVIAMISSVLDALSDSAERFGWEEALEAVPLANFSLAHIGVTYATTVDDLYRQIVLMHCSLSVLADEGSADGDDDSPVVEREVTRVTQKWTTQIRQAIESKRPELSMYFNREAVLIENGIPVRFGLLSSKLAAHFGLLRIAAQAAGMKDARAKMWELSLAKERNASINVALVFGTPSYDDVTISDRQRDQLKANMSELDSEAKTRKITLRRVHTLDAAVATVLELA